MRFWRRQYGIKIMVIHETKILSFSALSFVFLYSDEEQTQPSHRCIHRVSYCLDNPVLLRKMLVNFNLKKIWISQELGV